ncbi:amidohydrolase [Sphingobacterium sp. LRF_L2]|uniref:amidohydrolase n=1 Tax=Sphingobacterium sp. LRF_L2 TaxID=3369421 RepID=UPI003F61F419
MNNTTNIGSEISRKDFLKNTAVVAAGLTFGNAKALAVQTDLLQKNSTVRSFIKNVRLEVGFVYDDDNEVIGTETALALIEVTNGKVAGIYENKPHADAIDAKGYLMLPAFKDMHIHLDKTYYGDTWRATRRRNGGVKGMIALEQEEMSHILENSTYKAERLIELLQSKGSTFARSHVNIEPTSKLRSLRNLEKALANKQKSFSSELVAFPQHGVYYTDSMALMKEVAQLDIDFIGGLDPQSVDGDMERTMDFTVGLALDSDKGIDIHLHESGESGLKTVQYLVNRVLENPILKGKTFLSHCFVLGKLEKNKLQEVAESLAEAEIGIISTVPFGGLVMPIPTLYQYGVSVFTGNDSIVDHWNTFGTGSVLEKANLAARLYGYNTEWELSRILRLATADVLPLTDKGEQQWPKVGDRADFAFLDASCSAEAVARISDVKLLVHQGNLVFGDEKT